MLSLIHIYFHYLFYISFIFYIIWLYYRLSIRHVLICLIICFTLFLFPHAQPSQPNELIDGVVEKVSEKYCYVKTKEGRIKLYHHHNLQFKDRIKGRVKYLEMNKATNDYAFDEELYLLSQNVCLKAELIELKEVHHSSSFYSYLETQLSSQKDINSYQRLLLFGERNDDIQDDYKQLSQYSLVHLFALSGMHIHIRCV